MLIGRTQELRFLEGYYQRPENNLIALYGRKGIGKTEIIREFSQNKKCLYYNARECSMKEQLLSMQGEWKEIYGVEEEELSFEALIAAGIQKYSLLIIDEFHLILKNEEGFISGILNAMKKEKKNEKIMIILSASSVSWVENDMVGIMGEAALHISAFLKIKELTFPDIISRFPNYSTEEGICVYGILGGIPSYLNYWNQKRTVKENIMALFLHKDGRLYREGEIFLKTELRELALYNTILATLADGKLKLNDIYDRTKFSRAKISVYIKNLIQLDIVEKVFSYDTQGKENTKKGLYRIKDRFLHFWYRFVFPNLSQLENRKMEEVYKEKIEPFLDEYLETYFISVCQEYLMLMSNYNKLPNQVKEIGQWFGKEGNIDLIGEGENKSIFVGKCKWELEAMSEQDFLNLLSLTKLANVEPDYYYLFSKNGFVSSFELKAKGMDNLVLTTLEDL